MNERITSVLPKGADLIGTEVGTFKIQRLLGEGGMGSVFLAENPYIGRKVAIKVLSTSLCAHVDYASRFKNEAQLLTKIAHENVVSIFDFGYLADGRPYLVMDYHKQQDQLSESALGDSKIGTTVRGIGPCYADKVSRTTALRVQDLLDLEAFRAKLDRIVEYKNTIFQALYPGAGQVDAEAIFELVFLGRTEEY